MKLSVRRILRYSSFIFLVITSLIIINSCEFKFIENPTEDIPEEQLPENVTLSALTDFTLEQLSFNSIELSWVDENTLVEGYVIDKKLNDGDWILNHIVTSSTNVIDIHVEYAVLKYRVYAFYIDKVSPYTESEVFSNLIPTPANLALIVLDDNKIKLSWDDMSENEDGFIIDKKIGFNEWMEDYATVTDQTAQYIDDITEPCGTFAYRIRSYNSEATSENSNEAEINLNLGLVGSVFTDGDAMEVFISEDTNWYAFVADNHRGVSAIDVIDHSLPYAENYNSGGLPDRSQAISFKDERIYIVTNSGLDSYGMLYVVDASVIMQIHPLSDAPPESLAVFASCPLSNNQSDTFEPKDIFIEGNYAYVANGENGLSVLNVSNFMNPFPVSTISTNGDARKVFVKNNTAYIANGMAGLAIADVSDPNNPVLESENYPTTGLTNDVAVLDNYIYIADGENGLKYINTVTDEVQYLPTGGFVYSLYVQGQDRFQEDHVYLVDKELGIIVVDITVPSDPYILGLYQMDTMPVSLNKFFMGSYVYVADNEGLQIIQVAP